MDRLTAHRGAREKLVPEFLQEICTPDRLTAALGPLLEDAAARSAQTEAFTAVRHELKRDAGALAAEAIAALVKTAA